MTITLLIDLDDTLLHNHMDTFIPAYLGALGQHVANHAPPEKMIQTMMGATQKMFENNRPDRTLKESFDPFFYPPLGWVESEMKEIFDQFYEGVFPTLKSVTKTHPHAVAFMQDVFDRGYEVGIATNPLFPRTAIVQRLAWAGLSEDEYDFALIPAYENFHFAKPNSAFFAEFLTRLGWPEGPVIMIGNDMNHDIHGGNSLGLPTFWVSENGINPKVDQPTPTAFGTLLDILPWIDSVSEDILQPDFSTPSAMIGIMRGSPAALNDMLSAVPESTWTERPAKDEWSIAEIACHLRDVEQEINLPRVKTILKENNPFIHGVDSDSWAEPRKYINQNGPQALKDYIAARIELLSTLDSLQQEDWNRPIRHAIFGPSDLKETIRIMSAHERLHGKQIYSNLLKLA